MWHLLFSCFGFTLFFWSALHHSFISSIHSHSVGQTRRNNHLVCMFYEASAACSAQLLASSCSPRTGHCGVATALWCGRLGFFGRLYISISRYIDRSSTTYTITSNIFSITQLNVLLINSIYLYRDQYIDGHTNNKSTCRTTVSGYRLQQDATLFVGFILYYTLHILGPYFFHNFHLETPFHFSNVHSSLELCATTMTSD